MLRVVPVVLMGTAIMLFMDNNQTRIIELLREVHLIAFKEIDSTESENRRTGESRPPATPTASRGSPRQFSPATKTTADRNYGRKADCCLFERQRFRCAAMAAASERAEIHEDRQSGSTPA
jgi:hypothetical protein